MAAKWPRLPRLALPNAVFAGMRRWAGAADADAASRLDADDAYPSTGLTNGRQNEINSVDRARCGRYRDAIVRELPAGGPLSEPGFPGLPPWLPADALRITFPFADPGGVVTRAVIAWIARERRIPWFIQKRDLGPGRNLWRFDRVTLFNDGPRVWMEGEDQ